MTLSGVLMSAGLLIPFVDSFTMIVVLRIFFGIGAAISIPTTSAITMEWFKPKEFPLINGVNESGRALGVSLGVLCAIPIANINGWETTLFLYSILGQSVINLTIPPPISSFKENIPLILNRNTILLAIGAIGPLSLFVGYSAWLPTYYNEVQGMTMVKAGSIVSIIPLVSAMLNPISGIILSKFDNRKFLLIISGLILPMFAFGAVFAVNQIILIMFIVGIGSLLSIAIVSIITIPMELPGVTAPKVGIVTAAILTIGNLSSVISPIFIGSYTEYIGSYVPALLIVALMPITLVISGLFLHISSPRNC
jgi:MFS family permease